MSDLSWDDIKQQVHERAHECCEYCQTSAENSGQIMQVDHIDPAGGDRLDNVCLACWNCNNAKRAATQAVDPETRGRVSLFNPRTQVWADHFEWINGATYVHGLTPIGRATVARLRMNRSPIVVARQRWVEGGYHPLVRV
jgi:hypothetical protein